MKNNLKKLSAIATLILLTALMQTAFAKDPTEKGLMVAEKNLEGYVLRYRLLNLEERNELMKGMEGMKMHGMSDSPDVTHHLVVYPKGTAGKPVTGKIGFNITNPDATVFKTLTMGMQDGYGADVIFKEKGRYLIRMKALIGGKTIHDEIVYEVK